MNMFRYTDHHQGIGLACANIRRERGTALIMSLVILLILTILGVTAMGTASLEEKMAGNTQEINKAFQAAESGVNQSLAQGLVLNPSINYPPEEYSFADGKSGQAAVYKTYLQTSRLPRDLPIGGISGLSQDGAYFELRSEGAVPATGAKTTVNQGIVQTMPAQN